MQIILVRHAEVVKEYKHKYNGHIDIPLSLKGKQQAKNLALKLQNINFDKIYCSDLKRAKETLHIFNLKKETIYTQELREKSWGIHEGKSFEEIEESGIQYSNFNQWINDLDGENLQFYIQRVEKYFKTTVFQQNVQSILVVTHAGVIKTLLSILNNISLEEAFSIELPYSSYISLNI